MSSPHDHFEPSLWTSSNETGYWCSSRAGRAGTRPTWTRWSSSRSPRRGCRRWRRASCGAAASPAAPCSTWRRSRSPDARSAVCRPPSKGSFRKHAARKACDRNACHSSVSQQIGRYFWESTASLGVCWRALGGDTADAHVIKGSCGAAPCAVDQQAALQSHVVCQSPYHFPDEYAHYMHAVRLRVLAY